MIKGITIVRAASSPEAFDDLAGLLDSIGFEPGKGWKDNTGQGAPFLAPLGNLEIILGRTPSVPPILIEVTDLDHIHAAVNRWMQARFRSEDLPDHLSSVEPTHWNSRLFTARLTPEIHLGFWQSENPLHGRPVAVEGDLSAAGMRFAIITTRWNTVITDRLLQGSLDALHRSGAGKHDIQIVRVPGAWEIPSAARTLAEAGRHDAIITLGCLLRGETAHYEAIYTEVARGIGQSQQETGIPHAFGVLTCETLEQALDRAGLKAGNKGFEAAIAAIEMVSLLRKLAPAPSSVDQSPAPTTSSDDQNHLSSFRNAGGPASAPSSDDQNHLSSFRAAGGPASRTTTDDQNHLSSFRAAGGPASRTTTEAGGPSEDTNRDQTSPDQPTPRSTTSAGGTR